MFSGVTLPFPSIRSLNVVHSVGHFFLHLTQESAWGLFLQPQRNAKGRGGILPRPSSANCYPVSFFI